MFDLFTFNFAYVGVRKTGFGAGDYLIVSTGWNGETPDGPPVCCGPRRRSRAR
jgi:hypothetical protein